MKGDHLLRSGHTTPASWPDDRLTITNLGHATLLMNFFGVRIISDPTLMNRVGVSMGSLFTIGPQRHIAPPLLPSEMADLQVILITHAHMDHLDLPSIAAMPKSAAVISCDRSAKLIARLGFKDVRELKWGQAAEARGITVRAMSANHWGKRWPPLGGHYGFNSYVLEKDGHRMLLACDSAETDIFATLAANPPEVAAFSIGAYDPWIWYHANPEQVWSMFLSTRSRYLVPIHWGTFKLSKEPMEEPMQRLIAAAGDKADQIVLREIGGTWSLPRETRVASSPVAL
jgi:L-ascorbate metabolism protein UlaG (beta-lactamase superfamily)